MTHIYATLDPLSPVVVGVVSVGKRDNRLATYVCDEVREDVERMSERADKTVSEVVRQAIREYTDHDRLARLEQRLDRIERELETGGADADDGTHTHTSTKARVTQASPTVETARAIARRLRENHDTVVLDDRVERAIKDIGGADSRTVKKYRRELRERGHAYESPYSQDESWYLDREEWLDEVDQYARQTTDPTGTVREIIQPYPVELDDILGSEVLVDV